MTTDSNSFSFLIILQCSEHDQLEAHSNECKILCQQLLYRTSSTELPLLENAPQPDFNVAIFRFKDVNHRYIFDGNVLQPLLRLYEMEAGTFRKLSLLCWMFYSENLQKYELFYLPFCRIEMNNLTPSLSE